MVGNNPIRILHYSPHNENDGIAKYQEQYLAGMKDDLEVHNTFFDVTPLQFRNGSPEEQRAALKHLKEEMRAYDILHIQHEFGLYANSEFQKIVNLAKSSRKKVIVTVHLSPSFAIKTPKLGGLGPHSLVSYMKQYRLRHHLVNWHINPFKKADLLIVHNDITAESLKAYGINRFNIVKIPIPMYKYDKPPTSDLISEKLNRKPGDIIYCTVGMLHRYKGIFDAIKALKFLPANYKLAIIGGLHPISDEAPLYNKICDLINTLGLQSRVYITGFVEDDNQMNALIKECDVSVFPYDEKYYKHLSSASINLAVSNDMPAIAYPVPGFRELANDAKGGVIICETFAYYELARELQRIDVKKQSELSKAYAKKMAWPKISQILALTYKELLAK